MFFFNSLNKNQWSGYYNQIPINVDYVEIESVSSLIKQECAEHYHRLFFYCVDHYVTACALCVTENHEQCTRLKPIDELARYSKTSTELFDIEMGIQELDNTVDELRNHRQQTIDTAKDQRKTISKEIKYVRKQLVKESVLELSIDPQLKYLSSALKRFGKIQVVQSPCQIKVGVWEQQRAQTNVSITTVRNIDKTKLELIREILFENGSNITDCVIVNDGRMIFADNQRFKVLVYTGDGQLSKSITVGKSPFGSAVIGTNTVAVTSLKE
ncbi:unnamed protein product [Mytilus coruscus]|uniref:B box-type domain-containing protein n=1 Tax=Mytilus coruscus TaxID=42192 RepID=A0A6J8ARL0_MYTCO|nr:unnamed protein product [Mytilus coruscus]